MNRRFVDVEALTSCSSRHDRAGPSGCSHPVEAGSSGIGYYIVQSQRYLETDRVFAGILFIGVIGACTDWLFRLSASRLFKWA